LLHHMKNVRSVEHLYRNPGTGAAFEALVVEEIIKNIQALESAPWKFNYYRTRNGAEVDLILETPEGARIPVEIKFGTAIRRTDLRSLSGLIEQEQCPYGIVINNSDDVRLLTETIIQIPVGCF
jgi:uncharacterized protein